MIDKNEAPEGFEAVDFTHYCEGCFFDGNHCEEDDKILCTKDFRKDGHDVIFVLKNEIQAS